MRNVDTSTSGNLIPHIIVVYIYEQTLGVYWTSYTCGTWVHKRGTNCDYELHSRKNERWL